MMRVPAPLRARLDRDVRGARSAAAEGDVDRAWQQLEEAHALSQPWAWPHIRVHAAMLALAVRTQDGGEARGQLLRLVTAGPGSMTGKYPVGNTGRASVPATQPMPVPTELAALLADVR